MAANAVPDAAEMFLKLLKPVSKPYYCSCYNAEDKRALSTASRAVLSADEAFSADRVVLRRSCS